MINVSNEFKTTMMERTDFKPSASFSFQDGRSLTLTDKDFSISNNIITDGAESRSFPLGVAVGRSIQIEITNYEDQYSDYDFNMAVIRLKLNFQLSNTVESIDYGKYTITEPENYGSTIIVQAVDDMYKANKDYDTTLSFPASLRSLVVDSCTSCGIDLQTATFKNDDFLVQKKPENITHRQFLAMAAMLAGGYARINRMGRLCINSYGLSDFEENPADIDIKTVTPAENYHIFTSFISSPSIATDDVVITGIRTWDDNDQEYLFGQSGYVLEIDNQLIREKEEAAVSLIGDLIVGLRFRPFTANHIAYPVAEFGDLCYVVDRNQNVYQSILTDICFTFFGITTLKCAADSPLRNSSKMNSEYVKAVVEARKNTEKVFSAYDIAVQTMNQLAANTMGFFSTTVQQPDGSAIAYRHDKPTLAESKVVYKSGIDGFWVTQDYQGTDEETEAAGKWSSGFDSSGNAVLNILSVIGINADWVNAGAYKVVDKDGNVTFLADTETGKVEIVAESFSLRGKTIEEISEQQVNDFVDAVYTPAISNLQAQIDGQIETWFYDHIPTTDNLPASEWTTENEKEKHLGDLFYVVDNEDHGGEAYRWAKINGEYTWDYVEDTAVMEALAKAAHAQDTADNKRRVFVTTPTPPYDIGDLWVGDDSSELMRCKRARTSGNYVAEDWIKAVKYTDDSGLYEFVQNDYSNTIQKIYDSVDQKAETWYQSTDPSLEWTEKAEEAIQDMNGEDILDTAGNPIIGIWAKEKVTHEGDLWKNSTTNIEYIYQDGEWVEMPIPDEVFDIIDGKAQIFISQPEPPYQMGDLWFDSETADIMTCVNSRSTGSYLASDWEKRNKYTDDSYAQQINNELNSFFDDYKEEITDIQNSIDQKAETWYQSTDPSLEWTEKAEEAIQDINGEDILDTAGNPIIGIWAKEKVTHEGDLWKNSTTNIEYIYQDGEWVEMPIPDEVFDIIDGKAQIFVTQPEPPYAVGDLWFDSETADIMTCIQNRSSGQYNAQDWEKRNKYTDNSYAEEVAGDLSDFAEVVAGDIDNLQTQVDGKIETWYFDYQPTMSNIPASDWTTEEQRQKHAGDLFYWESKGFAYRFMKDGAWKWQPIQDSDISEALNAAAEAKDTADGKRRVFVSTPVPPYDVGDLWAQGESGDIMRCKTARQSGAYVSSDWEKASKYTDDSAVADLDLALDQWGIFNRLTNNGETEGVYLENGQLYISFSIARGGTLKLGGIKNENGLFEIYDNDGKLVGRIDNAGAQFWKDSEWLRIEESLLTGGHGGSSGSGGTQDGQLDLSKYNNGKYDVSLKSLSGDISLETYNGDIKVYRKGVSDYQGYLVQTGSDEFFTQEGIEVIFEDSTPMKMISMCDNPMGAPRNYKQKAILYRSSNSGYDYFLEGDSFMFEYGNYAVVGIQRKNISALTSLNPNTSINNGFSIDASLRDPSYEYIVFTSGSAWLNTYVSQEPNSSNGYYINITFLNTGTAAHTGSTNVTVIALKKR